MSPHLAHPEWAAPAALAALALGALVAGSWLLARRRARRLLGSARWVPPARLAADGAVLAAFAATLLALLGPHVGSRIVRTQGAGVDAVLLLDVSRSMDARDVPPSRLTRARALLADTLARLGPEDRVALAAFAGRGVLLTPLTGDHEALAALLPGFDTALIQPGGSSLAAGIDAAAEAFDPASDRPRVIVAVGDGEDPEASDETGRAAARRTGARVIGVALGTESGARVPDGGVALRDANRRIVVSRRDTARLATLARATDGACFGADAFGEVDLAALTTAIRRDAGRGGEEVIERRVPASRATALAALAWLLLLGEGFVARRRTTRRTHGLAPAAAAALGLVVALSAGAAGDESIRQLEDALRTSPNEPALLTALGVARAEQGRHDDAAHALGAAALAAGDARTAALAYYDLGVLELARERPEAARDAFLDALALTPDDAQARFNLEWALQALAAEQPPETGRRPDDTANDEGERPEPEQPEAQQPPGSSAAPQPATPPPASTGTAPPLDPERVERWLDGVSDDPARALRAAARESAPTRGRRAESRW